MPDKIKLLFILLKNMILKNLSALFILREAHSRDS